MLLIATDGGGCHTKVIELSEERYNRPEYMEATYNSIEMIFKKLKWHRQKNIITITEVHDVREQKTTEGSLQTLGGQSDKKARFLHSGGDVQTFHFGYQPGDTTVQERPPEGE